MSLLPYGISGLKVDYKKVCDLADAKGSELRGLAEQLDKSEEEVTKLRNRVDLAEASLTTLSADMK